MCGVRLGEWGVGGEEGGWVRAGALDSSRGLGMTGGLGVGWGEAKVTDWQCWAAPARPFDGAQGERPIPGDGLTPEAHLRPVSGQGKDGGGVTQTLLGESYTLALTRLGASETFQGGCPHPARTSTGLNSSGPSPLDSGSGGGMTDKESPSP